MYLTLIISFIVYFCLIVKTYIWGFFFKKQPFKVTFFVIRLCFIKKKKIETIFRKCIFLAQIQKIPFEIDFSTNSKL